MSVSDREAWPNARTNCLPNPGDLRAYNRGHENKGAQHHGAGRPRIEGFRLLRENGRHVQRDEMAEET